MIDPTKRLRKLVRIVAITEPEMRAINVDLANRDDERLERWCATLIERKRADEVPIPQFVRDMYA